MKRSNRRRGFSNRNLLRRRKEYEEHLASAGVACSCKLCENAELVLYGKHGRKDDGGDEASTFSPDEQEYDANTEFQGRGSVSGHQAREEEPLQGPSSQGAGSVLDESDSERLEHNRDINETDREERREFVNSEIDCSDRAENSGNDGGSVDNRHDIENLLENGRREPEPEPDPDDSDSSSEESESEGSDDDNFSLDSEALDQELHILGNSTVRDAIACSLALSVRFKLPIVALEGLLRCQNALFGYDALPKEKRQLWRALRKNSSGTIKHAYCHDCLRSLGVLRHRRNRQHEEIIENAPIDCPCGRTYSRHNVKYFLTLSLKKQLTRFFNLAGAEDLLSFRETRVKMHANNLEDIFDGEAYRRMREEGGPLNSINSRTYLISCDGISISDSSKSEAWPIFIRLNEVKPNLRQKCVFLAGLWVDTVKPNFNIFFEHFVEQANELMQQGVKWTNSEGEEVTTRIFPTCLVVDSKARAPILNMQDVTGYFGCTFCTHEGVVFGRPPVKFPVEGDPPEYDFEEPLLRTDESIRAAAEEALRINQPHFQGVKGPCALSLLDNFDLSTNQVTDNLHPWFEGVASFHTSLFLERDQPYSIPSDDIPTINRRITLAQTPTCLSRKPRGLDDRHYYTGTEWRNWLIHYSVPALQGFLPARYLTHWSLLAHVAFLLHKSSISQADLDTAEWCITSYLDQFEGFFGAQNMRYNLHVLPHSIISVRNWGPLWTQSTFPFESKNSLIVNSVQSPTLPIEQIVRHFQVVSLVESVPFAGNIKDAVIETVNGLMSSKTHKIVNTVQGAHFLGQGVMRQPTNEEMNLLQENNIQFHFLTEYERVIYNSIELRSPTFNPDAKSKNTLLYLKDDVFCCIETIVLVEGNEGENSCWLFVKNLDVVENATNASYIARVEESDLLDIIPLSRVLSLCVAVKVGRQTYVSPLPNHCEID